MKIRSPLRPSTQWPVGRGNFYPLTFLLALAWSCLCFGQTTVLWNEGFEADEFWDNWHVEGGVWAVGTPTSGPKMAFAGVRCAATGLDGDYPPSADARLVRDRVFIVPSAADHPRLRFWHWFRGGPGATRTVEIKVGVGAWQAIAAASGWISGDWSRPLFDLSPFSGQAVQIAFHFQSTADTEVAAGWYVDEVAVETGPEGAEFINSPEGFEAGLGDWSIDHGTWAVGVPTSGPLKAHGGTNCVGTVLGGVYQPGVDSRLISPEFVVPPAAENPRLRFWHWFSIWSGDMGQVEISVGGATWQALSDPVVLNSPVWTRPSFDLRPFAGQSVQIAFHFRSDLDANVAAGWYIDDVEVATGPIDWDPVHEIEGFESDPGNWVVDNGTWAVGVPAWGPSQAFDGRQCAGTGLSRDYFGSVNSRLISPEFTVPSTAEHPRLRFWHWLRNQIGDPATVEIRIVGSDWKALSAPMVAIDGTWARPYFGLDAFAGQLVQIAFHFQSNDDVKFAPGWFIDDVVVETGPVTDFINNPEGFELGIGDWAVDNGTWQIGVPITWPVTAYRGTNCAGTDLGANYLPGVDSRLISPPIIVPGASDNPRLRFWHWYSIWPGDSGTVEISVADGPWQAFSGQFIGNGVVWTRPWFDLRPFAGQAVRIAFHFQSNGDDNVGRGWYIDDVVVETGSIALATLNQAEGFELGLGNWFVDNGTWEIGVPAYGPGSAFKGTNCAATVLLGFGQGLYLPNTDSRLISPEFTVPCAEAGPRLRFAQWYDMEPGDEGTVEVREPGGSWQEVLAPVSGSSQAWITGFYDLTPYAGKTIQIAFRFRSNDDALVSTGWYIDEVKIQATLLQAIGKSAIPEGVLFSQVLGTSCQNLRYGLGPGAPPGVNIEPTLGILTWLPTEVQGPGDYSIQICVFDQADPSTAIDCVNVGVTVLEVNTPPVLDPPIAPKVIEAGVPLMLTVTAYDLDVPAQTLTYSLDEGAPFGASIDPVTGEFTWTPTPTQATDQSSITVRVTDNGNPPMSATTTFTANPQGPVSAVRLQITRLTSELVTICMEGGIVGNVYNLETTTTVNGQPNPADWTVLQSIWKGDQNFCETTHSIVSAARFYRVRSAP